VREPRRLGIRLASLLTERAGRGSGAGRGGAEEEEEGKRRFWPREGGGVGGVGRGVKPAGGDLPTEVSILVVVAPRPGGRDRRGGAAPGGTTRWRWPGRLRGGGFGVKQRGNVLLWARWRWWIRRGRRACYGRGGGGGRRVLGGNWEAGARARRGGEYLAWLWLVGVGGRWTQVEVVVALGFARALLSRRMRRGLPVALGLGHIARTPAVWGRGGKVLVDLGLSPWHGVMGLDGNPTGSLAIRPCWSASLGRNSRC
jgi:hypothetical protein